MRFKGLDLNLLHALDVLLEERSVSRAAERLHMSQPAASAALGRLRTFFKDELLVQHGKRMIPTAYAETLLPEIKRVLRQAESIISMSSEFDPATTQRTFRLMASDYIASVLIGPALQKIEQVAPGIQLDISLPADDMTTAFERGELDLVLAPEERLSPGHPTELLFEEEQVVVGWSANPLMKAPLSESEYLESAHVAVSLGPGRKLAYSDRFLRTYAPDRLIEIYSPSFTVVPWLLIGTRRVTVMHERLARLLAQHLPLAIQPLPIDVPPMQEMLQFHSSRANDAGVTWLRGVLHEEGDAMKVSTV